MSLSVEAAALRISALEIRESVLQGHRRQWRSRAFGLADSLREIANNPTFAADVRKFAAAALEAADLDGVER